MKKLLFISMMMVFFSSMCFAQTVANKTDAIGKKQGLWEEKTPAGLSKGAYMNDLKDGCWTTHSTDGKLLRIDHFNKGKRDGIAVEIDQRGYLAGETYYSNDLVEGTAKRFFYGTQPASLIDYVQGKINGKKKIYYENSAGKIQEDSEYKDDMKNGVSTYFTINGDPVAEYLYVNNMLQGVQKTYYPGRKIMSEQVFKDNQENGFSREYYENGKLKSEGVYVKGLLNGMWKEYNEEGNLAIQGNFVNGLKEGKWQELDGAGKVVKTTNYVKGEVK